MKSRTLLWGVPMVFFALLAVPAQASTTLRLKKSFIEANKDRATLMVSFVVDRAHDHPKSAK